MQTEGLFQQLPLELFELIGGYLTAQSYCNLRETCRATANLSQVAKLNLKAFQESVIGWTAENGRVLEALYFGNSDDWFRKTTIAKNKDFMDHVHIIISSYSVSCFKWMCDHYVGNEVVRMIRNDPSILQKVSYDKDVYKIVLPIIFY